MKLPKFRKLTKQYVTLGFFIAVTISIPFVAYFISNSDLDLRDFAGGADATITIYPDKENYRIEHGVNLWGALSEEFESIYSNPRHPKYSSFIEQFNKFGFSTLRYPNGCEISTYDWTGQHVGNIEKILDFADRLNVDMVFEMSTMGLIDPNNQHTYINPCQDTVTVRFTLDEIKNFVKKYSVDRKKAGKNYIKYYELGNEEWGYKVDGDQFLSPSVYINAAKKVSQAIREVVKSDSQLASEIKIYGVSSNVEKATYTGIKPSCNSGDIVPWGSVEYAQNANSFDNITFHRYSRIARGGNTTIPQGDSLYDIDFIANDIDLYRECMPNTSKFHKPATTEWNLRCWGTKADQQQNTMKFEHTLFMLGYQLLLYENDTEMINVHHIFPDRRTLSEEENGYGCNLVYATTNSGNNFAINTPGKAVEIIDDHFGNTHIKTTIDSPKTTFHNWNMQFQTIIGGSSKKGNKIYTILVNRKLYVDPDPNSSKNKLNTKIDIANYSGNVSYTLHDLTAPSFDSKMAQMSLKKRESKTVQNGFTISIRNQSAVVLEMTLDEGCDPDCTNKDCGDNGCGEPCGTCPPGKKCENYKCVACTPNCTNKDCGDDGCGKPCGTCTGDLVCKNGVCVKPDGTSVADLNGDGEVSLSDYYLFVGDYLNHVQKGIFNERSDLDSNGEIKLSDYALFVKEYLQLNRL